MWPHFHSGVTLLSAELLCRLRAQQSGAHGAHGALGVVTTQRLSLCEGVGRRGLQNTVSLFLFLFLFPWGPARHAGTGQDPGRSLLAGGDPPTRA